MISWYYYWWVYDDDTDNDIDIDIHDVENDFDKNDKRKRWAHILHT